MFIPRFRQVVIILAFLSNLLIAACICSNYRLYHKCSKRFVRITSDEIRTSYLPKTGAYNNLRVDVVKNNVSLPGTKGIPINRLTPNATQVTIRGSKTGTYICFNKMKKLSIRHFGHSIFCQFEEIISTNMYTEFRSLVYPTLYVGFNRNGNKLKKYTYHEFDDVECFRFQKISLCPTEQGGEVLPQVTAHPRLPPYNKQETALFLSQNAVVDRTESAPAKLVTAAPIAQKTHKQRRHRPRVKPKIDKRNRLNRTV